jgi:hypothetical protein
MRVFASPTRPILAYPARNVEHPRQRAFDVFLQDDKLLPGMKSPHRYLFRRPHFEMLDNAIKHHHVLVVSSLEVFFDLIRVVTFPHETVGHIVHLIVAILRDGFSDVFDVDFIPIFFLVYVGEG